MFPRRTVPFVLAIATILLLSPGIGRADTSLGVRGGLSVDPDQAVVGLHLNFDPVADNLYIVPSGEVGFGDDVFTLAINGDVQYRFPVRRSSIRPYAGGGLVIFMFDPEGRGGSDTELGVNILGGIYFGSRRDMFLDAKLGLTDDTPEWKFVFGVNF